MKILKLVRTSTWAKRAMVRFTQIKSRLQLICPPQGSNSSRACRLRGSVKSIFSDLVWWGSWRKALKWRKCQVSGSDPHSVSNSSTVYSSAKSRKTRKKTHLISTTSTKRSSKPCERANVQIWEEKAFKSTWSNLAKTRSLTAGTWTKFGAVLKLPRCTASRRNYRARSRYQCGTVWGRALSWPWNRVLITPWSRFQGLT